MLRSGWHHRRIGNYVAEQIAAKVGCTVSQAEPTHVFLNGERLPSGYFLVEHQSRTFLENRYGHDDFAWVRLKGDRGNVPEYNELLRWVGDRKAKKTMLEVSRRFALDEICAWVTAVSFCDTRDADQGAYYLDRRSADAVWRCLTWDMDASFLGPSTRKIKRVLPFSDKPTGLRATLFRKLCDNDPNFLSYYVRFVTEALNHRVDPLTMQELLGKAAAIQDAFGSSDRAEHHLESIRAILRRRPAKFRRWMTEHFDAGDFHACTVTGVVGAFTVDSYPKQADFRGAYPAGASLVVKLADDAAAPTAWEVNGQRRKEVASSFGSMCRRR